MRWSLWITLEDDGRPPRWWPAILASLIVLNLTAAVLLWAIRS